VFWTSWLIVEYYKVRACSVGTAVPVLYCQCGSAHLEMQLVVFSRPSCIRLQPSYALLPSPAAQEYIALRQTYLVRCTTMPGSGRGTSMGSATPLLTPSMHASRSPMKRALAVAQSPSKRGLAGAISGAAPGAGGLRPSGSSGSLTSLRGAVNRLKLPRRHASGAGEDFGEFAFRPSRFASPNGSPQHGSPSAAASEVVGSGSIFSFGGPSRFSHHARSNSKGSPLPAVAVSADGTTAAARGLAAALAALPPGSPIGDNTPTAQSARLQGAGSGVDMADNPAFAVTVDGTPEASGQSTPASDVGGPVRRPLLAHVLRSSDRQLDASPERQLRRQAVRHVGDDSRPPSADAETPVSASLPPQQEGHLSATQQQQQQQQQQVERSPASISFGQGPGFAAMRSISLTGHGVEDGESDTAASPEPRGLAPAGSAGAAADGSAGTYGMEPSGGSSAALLSLEQQQRGQRPGSGGTEGSGGSAVSLLPPLAPLPPGRRPRGPDALAALDALPAAPRHHASSSYDVARALGYDQAPPDPREIFAALASKGTAGSSSNSEAQLPAVYPPGLGPGLGGAAEPAPAAEPGGGEGIATRWWAAQHGVLCDTRLLHSSQSITMKGAVRVAGGGPGKDLAANASLYTCLVMDMPLERLKLRRIGVFPVLWRHMQQEPTQSLSRASTLALAVGAPGMSGEPREDIEAALEDLERGPSPPDSARYDVDAHALGLKSVMSSACNWWHQRGRLAEWRRDVRWAMFNKRVRIATEMFSELFGPDFDSIIPIYPTASVDKLAHKWDSKLAVLERLQLALRETPRHKVRRVTKLRERIGTLQKEVTQLQSDIAAERDSVLSDLPSTCFFATFRSQQAAAIASQTNLNPIMQRLFKVLPAPRPDDVNWPALQRSWWQRTMRPLYALPIILFFMLLPIGMFTGAFAQLNIALCGSPNDPGSRSDNWYCSDDRWATFLRNTITSLAPSLILSIYHMVFLPVMVYYAAQMEGQHVSLSALDRRCANLFFYWDVFNIFLGALFGGTVLAELRTFLENPSHIWSALGSAIPAASNFFINYVCYRALVMSAFRLFYPHQAIFTSILKWLHIIPRAKTARDKLLEVPPRNCRYGRDIGIPVLMNFVMVCSMCVTSPLILPFGLLYFAGLWAVWRYQALYVYQRQYESGGQVRTSPYTAMQLNVVLVCLVLAALLSHPTCLVLNPAPPLQFWPLVAHKVVGCQLIMVIFTASVLLFKVGGRPACLLRFVITVLQPHLARTAWQAARGGMAGLPACPPSAAASLCALPCAEFPPAAGRLHPGGAAVHHAAHLPAQV
jgi:hypothetical protein